MTTRRTSHAQAILQAARVAELEMAAALVKPRPRAALPRDGRRRAVCLQWLLAAERQRSADRAVKN
jgi:hypothetical protein